jgi:tetratricopeptide (TPR) repeat protein
VPSRLRRRLSALLFGLTLLVVASLANAAGEDAAVHDAVQQILSEDYPANLGPARKKLQDQLSVCLKKGCSGPVKAEVYIGLGMVASQLGQVEDAKQSFKNALQADPNAKLPPNITPTPSIKSQWEEVKAPPPAAATGSSGGGGASGGSGSGSGGPPAAGAAAGGGATDKDKDKEKEEEEAPSGLAATVNLIKEALKADQEGRLDDCIEKDKQALKLDDSPRTRLHLASCEARANKLVDALKDASKSLDLGVQKKDANVMRIARMRVKELLERIPHVTFVPPAGVTDIRVTFDDRAVPADSLTKKFSVDPGKHKVFAEGRVNGFTSEFEEEYEIKEKELVTVQITLKPPANDFITPGQIKCMLAAKSQEEVQKCLPQNQKSLVVRIAGDLSGYSDTNSVAVYTPAINASLVSPTSGWNLGGNFIVDAVSAASPDIVSSASPPFQEFRYAGGVTGGYKPGLFGAQVSLSTSSSPDYVSYTAGGRLTADLHDKLITPTFGYSYSYDEIGHGTNPKNFIHDFNPLKGFIHTHEFEGGITFVLSPTSLLLVGGTFSMERGDGSQPYRYIPMFDPAFVAPYVPNGATVDLVNRTRLPIKPLEQLPTERDRFAIGARFNKRIANATFRFEQRFYVDTWAMKASSSDIRHMVDLSRHLRVWPHLRLHAQTDTNFYNLAYTALIDPPTGQMTVPLYRTGDRELSPLITATAGGGIRVGLGEPEGEIKYGITLVGDVMYTRFLKALYVNSRTAVYGSVGFDVEF